MKTSLLGDWSFRDPLSFSSRVDMRFQRGRFIPKASDGPTVNSVDHCFMDPTNWSNRPSQNHQLQSQIKTHNKKGMCTSVSVYSSSDFKD